MSMWKVKKTGYFEAAHTIPGHDKCGRVHGHSYKVTLIVGGPELDSDGMLIDFSVLKEVMQKIIDTYDHQMLNTITKLTTAEVLAKNFCELLQGVLYGKELSRHITYYACEVWETKDNCAIYEEEYAE